ncbi:MAG: hypothetical protein WB609_11140 [Candidatus Cybelea sp.]
MKLNILVTFLAPVFQGACPRSFYELAAATLEERVEEAACF